MHDYWYESLDNFNTGINSGALVATLAVWGDPEAPNTTAAYGADTFALAIISLSRSTAGAFHADGGHPEGPTYYTFGLNGLQPALDALRTATGSTYGISLPPLGGQYITHLTTTPSNLYYNWADTAACDSPISGCGFMSFEYGYGLMWFARNGNGSTVNASVDPALAYVARQQAMELTASPVWGFPGHFEPRGVKYLINWVSNGTKSDLEATPPSILMNDTRLVFMRSGWGDAGQPVESGPGSTFAAVKGADNHLQQIIKATTHTHADGGSFIMDAGGVRWATDLGSGPYLQQGYFALQKWSRFYNSSSFGHNTLLFGNQSQDQCTAWGVPEYNDECQAVFTGFSMTNSTAGDAWTVVDLTGVYTSSSGNVPVRRGVALRTAAGAGTPSGGDWVGVRDEFASQTAANVTWTMHTFANVTVVSSTRARLDTFTASSAPVTLDVVAAASMCAGASFTVAKGVNGYALNTLVLVGPAGCDGFSVVMGLAPVPDNAPALLNSLPDWQGAGPWSA